MQRQPVQPELTATQQARRETYIKAAQGIQGPGLYKQTVTNIVNAENNPFVRPHAEYFIIAATRALKNRLSDLGTQFVYENITEAQLKSELAKIDIETTQAVESGHLARDTHSKLQVFITSQAAKAVANQDDARFSNKADDEDSRFHQVPAADYYAPAVAVAVDVAKKEQPAARLLPARKEEKTTRHDVLIQRTEDLKNTIRYIKNLLNKMPEAAQKVLGENIPSEETLTKLVSQGNVAELKKHSQNVTELSTALETDTTPPENLFGLFRFNSLLERQEKTKSQEARGRLRF